MHGALHSISQQAPRSGRVVAEWVPGDELLRGRGRGSEGAAVAASGSG